MPIFRRKKPDAPAQRPSGIPAASPPSAPKPPSYNWRSYDEVAEDYERTHAPITSEVAAALLSFGEVSEGGRLVDVGAGTGHALAHADALVGASGLAVGIDNAAGMLRRSQGRRSALAETINLPFNDAAFDVAMLNFSMPYFTKLQTAMFDVRRVIRPGGLLLVSTWGADEDELGKTWRLLVEEAIGRDILKAGIKDETPWAELLSDQKRLDSTLRDNGFRPVTIERRRFRFEVSREDYVRGHEIEAAGRYTRAMLGDRLWPSFSQRVRATFAEKFPETLVDFRDVLLARAGRP